jgi:hypothetical protein
VAPGHPLEYSGKISLYRREKQVVFVIHNDDGWQLVTHLNILKKFPFIEGQNRFYLFPYIEGKTG